MIGVLFFHQIFGGEKYSVFFFSFLISAKKTYKKIYSLHFIKLNSFELIDEISAPFDMKMITHLYLNREKKRSFLKYDNKFV